MWREHAIFAAFSPVDNAEIAVVVVSQNDMVGGGGKAAAPIAGKVIDAYWKLKEKRENKAPSSISYKGNSNELN